MFEKLRGVYAAALTPLNSAPSIEPDDLIPLLEFLISRGCHGALLFGTTGEGPSFVSTDKIRIMRRAVEFKRANPAFRILVGTGTPSLDETIGLTRQVFELQLDGVVVLPPYYYQSATDDGLFDWFRALIESAVPEGSALFGYHIPGISGVSLSLSLLERLKHAYPRRFAGIKDSSGDPDHARKLGDLFGSDLLTLSGNDRLFTHCLENSGSGCITALANLCSEDSRRVWGSFQDGATDQAAQDRLTAARQVLERYLPAPPTLKALYARWHGFPRWSVMPPLQDLSPDIETRAAAEFEALK